MNRELARLISLRCRLELAEGKFEDARGSLRAGLTLARQIGEGDILIQDLVAIAIATIMLGRVEEWVQVPGSPNLYWALTELPRPLIDVRRSMRVELNTIYRSFPALRELKAKKLSADEARVLVDKFFQAFAKFTTDVKAGGGPAWMPKLATTALALKYYPAAKKALIARGRTEKEVAAMPVLQVVALSYLEDYDRTRDDILKWLAVPPWQAHAELEKLDQAVRRDMHESGNVILGLLMPALVKVYHAQLRTERYVAGLRAAEAIRLHIARHGRPPAKLADLTEVPLPTDPFTGKGLDAWYTMKGDRAVLDVPPPPGMPARIGKRFEFALQKR
jgi:hypothetical protein